MELKVFRNQTQLNLTQNQPSVVIKQMNVAETKLVEIHCFENAHVQNYEALLTHVHEVVLSRRLIHIYPKHKYFCCGDLDTISAPFFPVPERNEDLDKPLVIKPRCRSS